MSPHEEISTLLARLNLEENALTAHHHGSETSSQQASTTKETTYQYLRAALNELRRLLEKYNDDQEDEDACCMHPSDYYNNLAENVQAIKVKQRHIELALRELEDERDICTFIRDGGKAPELQMLVRNNRTAVDEWRGKSGRKSFAGVTKKQKKVKKKNMETIFAEGEDDEEEEWNEWKEEARRLEKRQADEARANELSGLLKKLRCSIDEVYIE